MAGRSFARRISVLAAFITVAVFLSLFSAQASFAETITGTSGTCSWTFDDTTGVLEVEPTDGVSGTLGAPRTVTQYGSDLWWARDKVKSAVFRGNIKAGTSIAGLFSSYTNIETVDFGALDTSDVTDMSSLFVSCDNLRSVNISGFNTENVTSFTYMFSGCENLESLDVSKFKTGKATSMQGMFGSCEKLTSLDVSGFDTSNVKYFNTMFSHCASLNELDVSGFDTGAALDMQSMFSGCRKLTAIDVSNFKTGKVTNIGAMFASCSELRNVDLTKWDFSEIKNIESTFIGCEKLEKLDLTIWEPRKDIYMHWFCARCRSLKELDFSNFDLTEVDRYSAIASNCTGLKKVTFPENGPVKETWGAGDRWVLEGDNDLQEVTYGKNYIGNIFYPPEIEPDDEYTGNWLNINTGKAYSSAEIKAMATIVPGTYVREKAKYKVRFMSKGGTEVDDQDVLNKHTAEKPEDPTREGGYKFEGWYLKGQPFDFDTPIEEDTTLFARWSRKATYTLVYPDGFTKTTDDYQEAVRMLDEWELLAADLSTDEYGKITLEDWFKNGKIKVVETKVPAGYTAKNRTTEGTITIEGMTVENQKEFKSEAPPEKRSEEDKGKDDAGPDESSSDDEGESSGSGSGRTGGSRTGKPFGKGVVTGDGNNIMLFVMLLIASMAGLGFAVKKHKKATGLFVALIVGSAALLSANVFVAESIAAQDTVDEFDINKVDQYVEPVEDAVFSIYGKPTLVEETTSVKVIKEWDDQDNMSGKRPEYVLVDLIKGGKIIDTAELSEENGWKHEFKDLAKYDQGEEIYYYVNERTVKGYRGTVDEPQDNTFVITNTNQIPFRITKNMLFHGRYEFHHPDTDELIFFSDYVSKYDLIIKDEAGAELARWDVCGEDWNTIIDRESFVRRDIVLTPGRYLFTEEFEYGPIQPYIDPYNSNRSTLLQCDFSIIHADIGFTVDSNGKVEIESVKVFRTLTKYQKKANAPAGPPSIDHFERVTTISEFEPGSSDEPYKLQLGSDRVPELKLVNLITYDGPPKPWK